MELGGEEDVTREFIGDGTALDPDCGDGQTNLYMC